MLLKQRLASSCFILSRIPKRKDIQFEKQIKCFFRSQPLMSFALPEQWPSYHCCRGDKS